MPNLTAIDFSSASCPLPIFEHKQIVMGHGSGGKLSAELFEKIFLPAFYNDHLAQLGDQAVVDIAGRYR